MGTYGGDEVAALVLSVGHTWTQAGYAGEDTPKSIFPTYVGWVDTPDADKGDDADNADDTQMEDASQSQSGENGDSNNIHAKDADGGDLPPSQSVGGGAAAGSTSKAARKKIRGKYYVGDGEVSCWRPNMEIKSPMKDGLVEDWDALEQIWDYAFLKRLRCDPTEHPLIITETAWNTREVREKFTELAFEKYNFPAFFVAKDAVMTAFASGRPHALVVDSGGDMTSVVPVYDGYVLRKGIMRQPLGGELLSDQILQQFKASNVDIVPQYLVAKKTPVDPGHKPVVTLRDRPATASFHRMMQMRAIHDYKESVCQVSEMTYNEPNITQRPQKPYELPDGYNLNFGVDRFKIPEIMFNPKDFMRNATPEQENLVGLQKLISNSVQSCDIDFRPTLFGNVVLTGGNTLFPGFADRLHWELNAIPHSYKVKLHAPGNAVERKCGSWLGGSIMASLGTFHQLWISRKEYDETGAAIVNKKCI
ncbi:actin family [Mortierella sp. GBAus27b]|nr:Actin-like 6A [Mortierella sp. GBA43]KAI8349603.1 actin family [Mortierella sp. GBAus27b]